MHTFETQSPPGWRLYEGATSSASVRKIDTRSGGLIGLIGCTALNWRCFEAIRESAHAKPRPLPLDMEVVNVIRHRYRTNGSITQHHHDLHASRMRTIGAKTPQTLPLSTQYNFLVRIQHLARARHEPNAMVVFVLAAERDLQRSNQRVWI